MQRTLGGGAAAKEADPAAAADPTAKEALALATPRKGARTR